MPTSE
jgi:hypothetical protein